MSVLGRRRRAVSGQEGSTLIELLVTMPFAVLMGIIAMNMFGEAAQSQRDIETRSHGVMEAEVGLERMTRELRQATWVFVRSSLVIDMDTFVRASGSNAAVHRLVRYDCSTRSVRATGSVTVDEGGRCLRYEGPPVAWPPPATAPVTLTGTLIERFDGTDVFTAHRVDPATGQTVAASLNAPPGDANAPSLLTIRIRMNAGEDRRTAEIRDGVTLRNATGYAG